MHWLKTWDIALFQLINSRLINPVFDACMPFLSGNSFFYPMLLVTGCVVIWKGRVRGLVCVLMIAVILPLGDSWVCKTIKQAIGRPRPFSELAGVHQPGSKTQYAGKLSTTPVIGNDPPAEPHPAKTPPNQPHAQARSAPMVIGSMPSSHTANWFAATMLAFVYYRRSIRILLPVAIAVGFSRIYNGVHYPSDVLAGAILGAGYAAAAVWSLDQFWQWAGRKWFPLWWQQFPSLITIREWEKLGTGPAAESLENDLPELDHSSGPVAPRTPAAPHADVDAHWLRLGYALIALLLLARLIYIGSDIVQLTGDEAYQWLWSKHLALSYYSKPPMIAYAQFVGTALFGDTAFGVRFFSPVCAAVLSLVVMRFFAREFNARAAFFLLLVLTATPLTAAGAVLMTVDPFSVLFWTLAMIAGWRAVQAKSSVGSWAWVGLWMGLGFLSKYTELLQLLCWALFFLLWRPARFHLKQPGPYLALFLNVLCALPVLIWNYQHQWVTVAHVAGDAKAGEGWSPAVLDFLASETLLLNPVFFVATVWAAIAFWRRNRNDPRLVFLFSMGAPVFLVYFGYSFHSRLQPNWIAPSVLPLVCLMIGYWDKQWRLGARRLKSALMVGLGLGLPAVIIAHQTQLIGKFTGYLLPINQDPLHRARGWKEVASLAARERQELLAEGKPVFVIADHYRLAGELSFYWPAAENRDQRLIYCRSTPAAIDQFFFWPGYNMRKGENAIFITELNRDNYKLKNPSPRLQQEFETIENLGVREVHDHGRVLWRLQFFACRNLK